jgi:hypothetical protein
MENLSQCSLLTVDTSSCVNLAIFLCAASTGLLSISPLWMQMGNFSQPLSGTSAF